MKSVMTKLSNSGCYDHTQMITSICWEYTHTKQSLHMPWMWCWGGVFLLWDLPKETQNALVSALIPFAQLILPSTSPRDVCMQKRRGGNTPKHAQMFPCYYSSLSLRTQISDYLQMNDKQHLEICLSQLSTFENQRWKQQQSWHVV